MPSYAILSRVLPESARTLLRQTQASSLGYRVLHGTFWSFLGAVVSRFFGLLAFVFVARILGREGYGQFGIVQSTVSMFGVFAGFGLGRTATKYVAELRDKDSKRAGRIMAMAGVVAAFTGVSMASVLYFSSTWLAEKTLAAPAIAPLLRIGSLILILEAMNGAQMGALAGFEAFRRTAAINVWVGLASLPIMTMGVYLGGLYGALWALAITRGLNWALNHIGLRIEASRAGVPFVLEGVWTEIGVLWHYSIPSMLSGVMISPTIWICNAMLVNQPNGYAQMGIFQASAAFQQVLFFMGNTLSAPLLPMLANRLGQRSEWLERFNIVSTWALGAFAAAFFFGVPELATLLFGKDFASEEFTRAFLILVFCSSVVIYKQGLARVLSAHGLMWWGMLSNSLWALALVGYSWLFVSYGATGYAFATACAYITNTILFIPFYASRQLVPKRTMISPEAFLIWTLLLTGMLLNFLGVVLVWRLAFLGVSSVMMGRQFWKLLVKK